MKKIIITSIISILIGSAVTTAIILSNNKQTQPTTVEKAVEQAQEENSKNIELQRKQEDNNKETKGLEEIPYSESLLGTFVMSQDEGTLIDTLLRRNGANPKTFISQKGGEAIAFNWNGKLCVLSTDNYAIFKLSMDGKNITDMDTLNSIARSLFGECYSWENANAALKNQNTIQNQKIQYEFNQEMDQYEKDFNDSLNQLQIELDSIY